MQSGEEALKKLQGRGVVFEARRLAGILGTSLASSTGSRPLGRCRVTQHAAQCVLYKLQPYGPNQDEWVVRW